jgi:Reverse transcriptase (RNA-dependent DNA polymerase)
MTDETPKVTPTPAASTPVTREQQRRNTAEQDAIDDSDKTQNEHKKKEKDAFKGKVEKMDGNVFQLAEEGRKGNQFTQTLEALQDYAAIELEHAKDLSPLFGTPCCNATIPQPSDQPPMSADGVNRVTRDHRLYIAWKFECENHNSRKVALATNQHKLFTVILLQCSQSVKSKVESTTGYETAKSDHNCQWLITTLKNICHKFEHTENRFVALVNAKAAIFNYRQGQNQTTTDYYESFKELLSVLESYGGRLHDPEDAAPDSASVNFFELSVDERNTFMRDRYSATLFLRNSDNHRYEQLKSELSNDFSKGRDEYPTTLTDAHQLLLRYKGASKKMPSTNTPRNNNNRSDNGRGGPGRGNTPGRGGKSTGRSFVQVAFCLAQVENHFPDGIPTHYVLLDSDSTVSIFCNADLLTDIHEVDEPLYLETNGGGYQVSTQMGTLKDFGPVWYNPDSIANILSLAQVRTVRRVTMDTDVLPAFQVHKPDGSGSTLFTEHESGLYLHDASSTPPAVANPINALVNSYSCLQTVAHNKTKFTIRQVEAADAARKLYRLLGRPGYSRFLTALKDNHILNCPITIDDAQRAESIYGKDVAFLKGKTTARPAKDHVPDFTPIPLPPELLSLHPDLTLCFDLFYVLGLGFSLSTSRSLRYLSCHHIANRSLPVLKDCIASDLSVYRSRGFRPVAIHADGEFHAVQTAFPDVRFSICAVDDHVPEIERAIRTVKECIRTTIHGLPFGRLPRVLVKELAASAIRTLNMLPHPDGVSSTLSPATIVTGHPKTDYRTLHLEFGTYVQVYDGTSNDTKSRTLGAIATNPTGNSSGDYYFMSLATGHRIHRRSWTVLPISDSVISRVEAIAFNEDMPLVDSDHTLTEYDPDEIVDLSAYDRTYVPPTVPGPASDHDLTTDAYTDTSDDDASASTSDTDDDRGHHPDFDDDLPIAPLVIRPDPLAPAPEERLRSNEPLIADHTIDNIDNTDTVQPENIDNTETVQTVQPEAPAYIDNIDQLVADITNPALASLPLVVKTVQNEERPHVPTIETVPPVQNEERTAENEERTNVRRRPGLRKPKPPTVNYKHRFGFTQTANQIFNSMPTPPLDENTFTPTQMQSVHKAITGLMFTQMSAHKGIKKHGQAALDALRKEFLQFRALDVLEPLDAFTLTDEQKTESLRAISVIKEKRDGSLKGRTCADGSAQQGKFSKAETGSPTISNDALFLSVMIDAYENRDVATADVAGAYLHALMKRFISMRFVGWAVDLLCEVNPEYTKYVVYEGKVKVLYVRCNKAIYGCVVSGVLWYELFSETLEQHGFTTNPYDFCVANATIEGSQCTIGWFVDDTKISHINPNVVTSVINILEHRFGKMTVTRGHQHKFLGMNITYLGDGTATIHMPTYINEAITESELDLPLSATSPCASSLLVIDPDSPALSPVKAKRFHSVVAKLIYVGTRSRTDILLALSFLCGRVSSPTEQDEKKLKRLLSYLRGTIDLTLRIGADSLNQFATWVDASFAVHPDMRSHTGGVISFGRGGLLCKSKKQNINTKSSTEAELIGASDYLPNTLYVKLFMEAQGYPIQQAIFHQDNESAIKMEQNGKASCGQRSRHIDIRYFFITDHSKRNSIHITHCPTEDMLADFFTKPLQGSLFRKFRSVLLGEAHTDTLSFDASPVLLTEERVEGQKNPANSDPGLQPRNAHPIPTDKSYEDSSTSYKTNASIVDKNTSHSIEKYPEDK